MEKPLANILYLSLPEDLQKSVKGFCIDPSILVPAELPEGSSRGTITIEIVISSMLKILSFEPSHANASYYRSFVLAYNPHLSEEFFSIVFDKMEQGDFSTAEELLRAMLGLDPENHALKLNLAFCLDRQYDLAQSLGREEESRLKWQEADSAYRELLLLSDSTLEKIPFYAGVFFLKTGCLIEGVECLKSFLSRKSEDSLFTAKAESLVKEFEGIGIRDHRIREAYDLILGGKEEKALEILQFLIKGEEVSWNAWFLQGWSLRRLGRYKEAQEAFDQVLLLNSGNLDALMEKFVCSIEQDDWGKAEEVLEQALLFNEQDPRIFLNYGLLFYKKGLKEESKSYFEKVLEVLPDDPLAKKYLELLESQLVN